MPDHLFDNLEDLFSTLHTFRSLGNDFISGTKIEAVEQIESAEGVSESGKDTTEFSYELDPAAISTKLSICPGIRPDLFRFCTEIDRDLAVSVQGPFNGWGKEDSQTWVMEDHDRRGKVLYFDRSRHKDQFCFRYASGGRHFIDQRYGTLSILPGKGICTIPDDTGIMKFRLCLFPAPSVFGGQKKAVGFTIFSTPRWMRFLYRKGTFRKDKGSDLEFTIAYGQWDGKHRDYIGLELLVTKTRIKIPIELHIPEDPIQPCLDREEVIYDHIVGTGEKIRIPVPLATMGTGTLNLIFFGNGVSGTQVITSDTPGYHLHEIECILDTARLSQTRAKSLTIRIMSDTWVANARILELRVRLELLALQPFPVTALDWKQVPLGHGVSQDIEFIRSDSYPGEAVLDLEIPDPLRGKISAAASNPGDNRVKFVFQRPEQSLEKVITGQITVHAEYDDGKHLIYSLPVELGTVAVNGRVTLGVNRSFSRAKEMVIALDNLDQDRDKKVRIASIFWEKFVFQRVRTLKEEGSSGWPCVMVGERKKICFSLNRRRAWLWPKFIRDRLEIRTNIRGNALLRYKILLLLVPKIVLLPCWLLTGRIWIKKRTTDDQQCFIIF